MLIAVETEIVDNEMKIGKVFMDRVNGGLQRAVVSRVSSSDYDGLILCFFLNKFFKHDLSTLVN